VLIGQALAVPVYYKHERFSEIIAFPPMPISFDFSLWLEKSSLLFLLDRPEPVPWAEVQAFGDEQLETLIDRIPIDGTVYVELSPTGQIFHETFKDRFRVDREQVLPPPALRKRVPELGAHDWKKARGAIETLLRRIVDECPYVATCRSHYWNPDLPSTPSFRLRGDEIEGVLSNGGWTAKIKVDTSATTPGQRGACVADLNLRLQEWL
jgi:hypothetical protein